MTHNNDKKPGWAFVLPWNPTATGGVNTVVRQLSQQIASHQQFHPWFIIADWDALTPQVVHHASHSEIRMRLVAPMYDNVNIWRSRLRYRLQRKKLLHTLLELINTHQIKVVNPHYLVFDYFVFSDCRQSHPASFTLIYSAHGTDIRTMNARPSLRQSLWMRYLNAADHIVACSDDLAQQIIEKFPATNRRKKWRGGGVFHADIG